MSVTKTIERSLTEPAMSVIEDGSRWFARSGAARNAAARMQSAFAVKTGWRRPAAVLGATVAIGALAYYNHRRARRKMTARPLLGFATLDGEKKSGTRQIETATSAIASSAEGMRAIAAEATDYSRQSFEDGHALMGKLMHAQKLDDMILLQSEFAQRAYGNFITRAFKLAELWLNMTQQAFASKRG